MVKDRNESLQVNSRWKALDEIYKIYKLLRRSAFKNSAKFLQTFSHFYSSIFKNSLLFAIFVQITNFTNVDENFERADKRSRGKEKRENAT